MKKYCIVCDQSISIKNLITHPETGDDFHKNCVDYESQNTKEDEGKA